MTTDPETPAAMWARLGVPPTVTGHFAFMVNRLPGHHCWRQSLHCGHGHLAVQDLSEPAAERLARQGRLVLAETLGRWARTGITAWDCICSGYAAGLGQYVFERMGGAGPLDPPPLPPAPAGPRWNLGKSHALLAAGAIAAHGATLEREYLRQSEGGLMVIVRLLADGQIVAERLVPLPSMEQLDAANAAAEAMATDWLLRQGVDIEYLRRAGS